MDLNQKIDELKNVTLKEIEELKSKIVYLTERIISLEKGKKETVVKPNTTIQAEAERKRTDPKKVSRKKTILTGPTGMIEDEEVTYKTLLGS